MHISQQDIAKLEAAGWSHFRISYLEEYLSIRNTLPILTIEVADRFADGEPGCLKCVAAMLSRIDPAHQDLPILYAAGSALARRQTPL